MAKYLTHVPESIVNPYKGKQPKWGPIGYVVYKRTYARRIDEHTTEEWWQTTERCINGLLSIGGAFTRFEVEKLFDHWFNLRLTTGGRGIWQLGTPTVEKVGADSLQNCWSLPVDNRRGPSTPFEFAFNQLMLGGGVGFTILPEYVYELPVVKGGQVERTESWDCDLIVTDNREGWVYLMRRVLLAHFEGKRLSYNTNAIRAKGKKIGSFGGVASGSEILVQGIGHINRILLNRVNKKLRPIDVLDILNIIGSIVVSGNVRRSAEIAIGSPFDTDFLIAKNWEKNQLPDWRGMSNNTIQTNDPSQLNDLFWDGYTGSGEPYGLFNLDLARQRGRLIDLRPDSGVTGLNPCGEITLEPYEACNLLEIFLPNTASRAQFCEVSSLACKIGKTISAFPFSDPYANAVKQRNHRIGIGLTGFLQDHFIDRQGLIEGYDAIQQTDEEYSQLLGVSTSIKTTTVKPSGTLSSLAGCVPGAHPAESQYYIRTVRFAADDPLVHVCRSKGYHVEPRKKMDGTNDMGTMVISFPVKAPAGAKTYEGMDVIQQLETQKYLQTYWSDNAVSITCRYNHEDVPRIKDWLSKNYRDSVKSCSFLLFTGHGFAQAPYQPISKGEYEAYASKVSPIEPFEDAGNEDRYTDFAECEGGACPTR